MKNLFIFILIFYLGYSHSGRTDSSGGHNCSAKSQSKGLCTGYHSHNGGYEEEEEEVYVDPKLDLKKNLQKELKRMGFYDGNIDGVIGSGTKSSITNYINSSYYDSSLNDLLVSLGYQPKIKEEIIYNQEDYEVNKLEKNKAETQIISEEIDVPEVTEENTISIETNDNKLSGEETFKYISQIDMEKLSKGESLIVNEFIETRSKELVTDIEEIIKDQQTVVVREVQESEQTTTTKTKNEDKKENNINTNEIINTGLQILDGVFNIFR